MAPQEEILLGSTVVSLNNEVFANSPPVFPFFSLVGPMFLSVKVWQVEAEETVKEMIESTSWHPRDICVITTLARVDGQLCIADLFDHPWICEVPEDHMSEEVCLNI